MLEGMQANARTAQRVGATYWPYLETPDQPARGLLRRLSADAALIITDDYPQFIVPAQTQALGQAIDVALHAIDGNGMIPLALLGKPVAAAAHLRPRLHKLFAQAWESRASAEPDFSGLPTAPEAPFHLAPLNTDLDALLSQVALDPTHHVPAVPGVCGGSEAAKQCLDDFLRFKLARYAEERSQPDDPVRNSASRLSPYLHYGHIGIQEVVERVLGSDWRVSQLNLKARNKDGFFCDDANVNGYLDEAITWRDVGFHWSFEASHRSGTVSRARNPHKPQFNFLTFDFADSSDGTLETVLPPWAWASLKKHASDPREHVYTLEQFELAQTHDPLWNMAQIELVVTGRMHNYLRMLWGKKVLEWSPTPEDAYQVLEHLNNKYALDGRDPNSYTGILWCFGLFDRPWPPERPIYGSIRYMTSASTEKKFKLAGYKDYIRRLPSIHDLRQGQTAVRPASLFDSAS
jgi:deoxyribodipyrimidine photo-lyase